MNGTTAVAEVAERLAAAARKAGADAALAHAGTSASVEAATRLGEVENVERSESRRARLQVFLGRRTASVTTEDWTSAALDDLAARAVAVAKATPEDPHAGPPAADRLIGAVPDLGLLDDAEPSVEDLIARAKEAEDAARAGAEIVNSNGATASRRRSEKAVSDGAGFTARLLAGGHGCAVSVLGERDGKREIGWEGRSVRRLADLPEAAAIGEEAARRARRRLGARKAKSAKVPVVFDRLAAPSIIGAIASAISGPSVARGVSWLKTKRGERILPENVTIMDDPLIRMGLGSRPFDGEGVACAPRAVVEKGVLTGWLHNAASARQLGEDVTGHAEAGGGVGVSNFDLGPGSVTREALIADIEEGLLVEGMFGAQVNPNTGALSVGVHGRWIEKGEIAYPVSEATVAGDLLEALLTLLAADDFERRGAVNAPTIRLDALTVAGR